MEYKGSVTLISGLTQANGGKFPLVTDLPFNTSKKKKMVSLNQL